MPADNFKPAFDDGRRLRPYGSFVTTTNEQGGHTAVIEYYPEVLWKVDPHEPDFLGCPTVDGWNDTTRIEIGGEVVEIDQGERGQAVENKAAVSRDDQLSHWGAGVLPNERTRLTELLGRKNLNTKRRVSLR
jgi:hypothetical protein